MSFYILFYFFGIILNIINFMDIIKNNPIAQLKIQLLNDKGKFYFYLQMFILCLLSWILVFINFVYKIYIHIERKKK
jgi:hypothetical protein